MVAGAAGSHTPHLLRKRVHDEIQLVADEASRLPRPHHELVEFALARRALVAVVLLIAAMELHELGSCLIDVGGRLARDFLHQWMAQVIALILDGLDLYRAADGEAAMAAALWSRKGKTGNAAVTSCIWLCAGV